MSRLVLDVSEQSLVSHLQLSLGLELSLQLFHASSVSQHLGYTSSQESSVVNSCGFFKATFLLLLPLGKSEPSIKYLQHKQWRAVKHRFWATDSPCRQEQSLPLDSNRQSSNTQQQQHTTTRTKGQGFKSDEAGWVKTCANLLIR